MHLSFDPPGENVPEGNSGGGGGKILLWLGGGCLLFVVLLGLALVVGAYEGVTCCKDLIDEQQRARGQAVSFARDLADEHYPAAWSKLTPAYQTRTTFTDFRERMRPWSKRLEGRQAEMLETRKQMTPARTFWDMEFRFSKPGSDEVVVMALELEELGHTTDAGHAALGVDRVSFRVAERAEAAESPANSVRAFNKLVQKDDWEGARRYLGEGYGDADSLRVFREFVDQQGALFSDSEVGIDRVETDSGGRAGEGVVVATHDPAGAAPAQVRYTLRSTAQGRWVITGVAPMIEKAGDVGGQGDADSRQDAGDALPR